MVVQRWNDQRVDICVRAKAEREWDKLVIVVEQCPPLPKPILVKLTLKQLLQVLGLGVWETCFKMQHHKWRRMKIYKRCFDPFILHMHDD
jgi:hypothetical protein